MNGKDGLNSLIADEQLASDEENNMAALEEERLPEPMEEDIEDENSALTGYSTFIHRLTEILLGHRSVLDSIGDEPFDSFEKKYQVGLEEGVELLSRFRHHYEDLDQNDYNFGTVAQILDLMGVEDEFQHLTQQTKLSITLQLELLLARWRTHQWIMQNHEFIQWCKSRSASYPELFALLQGQAINTSLENKTLEPSDFNFFLHLYYPELKSYPLEVAYNSVVKHPVAVVQLRDFLSKKLLGQLDFEWLVDSVHPHLNSVSLEDEIHSILTSAHHTEALLRFSAALDHFEHINLYKNKAELIMISKLLVLIDVNRLFFNRLIVKDTPFTAVFTKYIKANKPAMEFLISLRQEPFLNQLSQLLQIQNLPNIIENDEMMTYFQPLFNILLKGLHNERLNLMIKLWTFSLENQRENKKEQYDYLKALTWLEMNRGVIAMSFEPDSAFSVWLNQQEGHIQSQIRRFSAPLVELLTATEILETPQRDVRGRPFLAKTFIPVCCDTRPEKLKEDTFPDPMACYQDAICGLSTKHRNTLVSCVEGDVLLDVFLSHPQNHAVLAHIQTQIRPQVRIRAQDGVVLEEVPEDQKIPVIQSILNDYQKTLPVGHAARRDDLSEKMKAPFKAKMNTVLAEMRVQMIERALPRPLQDALNKAPRITPSAPILHRKVQLPRLEAQQRRVEMENERQQEEIERAEQNRAGMML